MLLPPDARGIMPSDIESGGINRVVTIGVAVAANDFLAHFLQADALDRACGAGEIFLHKGGVQAHGIENLRTAIGLVGGNAHLRSEEHTSELQSLMRISYAVFCLKKKKINIQN